MREYPLNINPYKAEIIIRPVGEILTPITLDLLQKHFLKIISPTTRFFPYFLGLNLQALRLAGKPEANGESIVPRG